MRREPRRRMAEWVLLLAALPAAAYAQDSDEVQALKITRIGGAIFNETQFRNDEQTLSNSRISEKDLLINNGVELDARGYLYHPNFLEFVTAGQFTRADEHIERFGESEKSEGNLVGYNLGATMLRAKPATLRLFADKTDRLLDRTFALRTELERQNEGGELLVKGDFPMSVLLQRTESHETSETRIDDEEILYGRFRVADTRDPDYFTEFTYDHEQIDETIQSRTSTGAVGPPQDLPQDIDEFNLVNRYAFGPGTRKSTLSGQFNFRQQTGAFDNETMLGQQSLDLIHTDTFSTFYQGRYRTNTSEGQDDRNIGGEAGFRKQVYDSLEIVGRALGNDETFEDGLEQRFGGGIDLDYRKETPIGLYTSFMSAQRLWHREESDTGTLQVFDEAITLNGFSAATLSRPNVQAGSIVVTDLNQIPYVEGVDYVVRLIGSFTEIARLLGGSIDDGETVLVDYTVATGDDAEFTSDDFRWRHRVAFEELPVAVYLEYRYYDESLTAGDDPGNLDHSQSLLVGSELLLEDFTILGEYEIRRERLNLSSNTSRFRGEYHKRLGEDINTSLSAGYEMIDYVDGGGFDLEPGEDYLDTVSAAANVSTKLNRETLVRAQTSYVPSRGRVDTTQGRVGGALIWRRGQLSVSLDGYYSFYEQEQNEGTTNFIGITIRRSF